MTFYSQNIQKCAALLLLLGAILIVCALISPIITAYNQNQQRILQLKTLNYKYQKIAAFQPKLPTYTSSLNKKSKKTWYLQPTKKSLAKANLRTRLKLVSTTNGARIESIREIPEKTKLGLVYVGLHIKMSGSYKAVFKSLHKYETSEPFLFVENLQLTGDRVRQRASTKQAKLTAQFIIRGALLPAAKNNKNPKSKE